MEEGKEAVHGRDAVAQPLESETEKAHGSEDYSAKGLDGANEKGINGVNGDHQHDGDAPNANVKWTARRIIAIAALCMVYVGSQIILYFVGGELSYIAADIGTNFQDWLGTANTLAVAAVCPFVGYLTDLVGRRWITIFGALLLCIASVLVATMHSLGQGVVGMALGGIGAGICELNAIAGVAEITPVRLRGVTLALVTFSILPFIPYQIYIQEFYLHSSWRWSMLIVGIWNFVGLLGILFAYNPPARQHASASVILREIDYLGGFLSISGVTLFLVGLQSGGYQFPWQSGQTLAPLIIGIIVICLFVAWEAFGAKKPMVPGAIFRGQRVVALAYVIVFIAGMNFYSLLNFYPLTLEFFYPPDPILIGKRAIGYPLAILIGACTVNYLISYTRGHIREMFVAAAVLMTAFSGALAAATPFNPVLALVCSTFASFGVGAIIVPALTVALYACPDEYIGTTTALSLSVRFLGGSVGNTIYFNIFNEKIAQFLPADIAQYAIQAGLPAANAVEFIEAYLGTNPTMPDVNAALQVPGSNMAVVEAASIGVRWAYANSLAYVWYTSIAFGIVSIICCAMLPNIRRFMTNRVAVDVH